MILVKRAYMVIECWIVTVLWLSSIAFATAAVSWDGADFDLTLGFGSNPKSGGSWFPSSVTKSIYGYTGNSSGNDHKLTRTVARGGSSMFASSKRPPPKLPSHPWENQARQGNPVSGRRSRQPYEDGEYDRQEMIDHEALIDALEPSSDFEIEHEIAQSVENDLLANSPKVDVEFHYENFGPRQLRSIPFLILTPNVDHWKLTAETLASFGYSVFVCERRDKTQDRGTADVAKILDGLGWKHAIVVGCDEEATWAMEAAMDLSPRVAGLILVGDLSEASSYVHDITKVSSPIGPDLFLETTVVCPFRIVWDGGDGQQLPPEMLHHRSLILGGGLSPHRRQPGHVAWTLARFSNEEVIAPSSTDTVVRVEPPSAPRTNVFRLLIPDSLGEFGTKLVRAWQVSERAIAAIIFSVAAVNVFLYQLNNVHTLVRGLKRFIVSPVGFLKAVSAGVGVVVRGIFGRPKSATSSRAGVVEEAGEVVSEYTSGDAMVSEDVTISDYTSGDSTESEGVTISDYKRGDATDSLVIEGDITAELSSTEHGVHVELAPTQLLERLNIERPTVSEYTSRDSAGSNAREEGSVSVGEDLDDKEPEHDELEAEIKTILIPRWADGSKVTPPPDQAEVMLRRLSPIRPV